MTHDTITPEPRQMGRMIDLDDIRQARERTTPFVHVTPLEASRTLGRELGAEVRLKLEMFQNTGSFKPRGAFNKLLSLPEDAREAGVVALSGGNFAQAVAYAGQVLGVPIHVVMPDTTPRNYLDATRGYGAAIETAATFPEMYERIDAHQRRGLTFTHPYDDPWMMAGNGTLALELLEQTPAPTHVFVSVGGGGLLTGVATALKSLVPDVRLWGVETEGADAMAQALRAGEPVSVTPTSLAKTLGAPVVAADALKVAQEHLEDLIVVSDREAFEAQAFLLERAKVVTELAASCTLAAARRVRERFDPGDRVVLILCGGNVAMNDLSALHERFGRKRA